jgi:hypothetical protein
VHLLVCNDRCSFLTFQDNLSIPSSRVKLLGCVKFDKSAHLDLSKFTLFKKKGTLLQQMSSERPRTLGVDIDAKGYSLCGDKTISSLIAILNLLCRSPWSKLCRISSCDVLQQLHHRNKEKDTDSPRSVDKKLPCYGKLKKIKNFRKYF